MEPTPQPTTEPMNKQAEQQSANEVAPTDSHLSADKYLCFQIDSELYGFELPDVKEILRDVSITRVPNTESWLLGVANLRGRVTPIFDLRMRLCAGPNSGAKRWVVVLEVEINNNNLSIGAVVDSLPEVISLRADQIQKRSDISGASEFVVGLGKTEKQVVLLIDPNKLIWDTYQQSELKEE